MILLEAHLFAMTSQCQELFQTWDFLSVQLVKWIFEFKTLFENLCSTVVEC